MHVLFAAHNICGSLFIGLHVFDVQRAEQDDGALECNHSTRKVRPSILGSLRGSLRCNVGSVVLA